MDIFSPQLSIFFSFLYLSLGKQIASFQPFWAAENNFTFVRALNFAPMWTHVSSAWEMATKEHSQGYHSPSESLMMAAASSMLQQKMDELKMMHLSTQMLAALSIWTTSLPSQHLAIRNL